MNSELKSRIVGYISKCPSCTIATASPDGEPGISTVFFNNAGLDIYFNTGKDSQKVRNILANPRVAIAMQQNPNPKNDREIQGIQYSGIARVLSDTETTEVPGGVLARHRVFNNIIPGNSVIVKVTPSKIYFIDYSQGFRHRELLQL